jgi:hypothetical protein
MQSMALGSHVLEQLESQYVVHIGSGGTCSAQPPLQPTSRLSGVQSAVHPPETSILQSIPCEKSKAPQGVPASSARALRDTVVAALTQSVARTSIINDGAGRRRLSFMIPSKG